MLALFLGLILLINYRQLDVSNLVDPAYLALDQGWRHKLDKQCIETGLISSQVVLLGYWSFISQDSYTVFYFIPNWWVLIAILSALGVGVMGAALIFGFITVLAISLLVNDMYPFTIGTPLNTVWLMQEYLAIVSIFLIDLALLLREMFDQKHALLKHKKTLKEKNLLLVLKEKNAYWCWKKPIRN